MTRMSYQSIIWTLLLIIMIFGVFLLPICFSQAIFTQDLGYNVKVGDSQTYIYKKVYDILSDNPYQFRRVETNQDGYLVIIIIQEGTLVTYTITTIPHPGMILFSRTYNRTITLQEELAFRYVLRDTINNKSYWEEFYREDDSTYISGDLVVLEEATYNSTLTYKWNWKTGWLAYYYFKSYNENNTIYEEEIDLVTDSSNFGQNIFFGIFMLVVIVIIIITIRLLQKR
ncbi:MAG: hypothetical protein ACFE95_01955 [Candidatus Hodarchaeota archaeon]